MEKNALKKLIKKIQNDYLIETDEYVCWFENTKNYQLIGFNFSPHKEDTIIYYYNINGLMIGEYIETPKEKVLIKDMENVKNELRNKKLSRILL